MGRTTIKPCGPLAGRVLSGMVLFQINAVLTILKYYLYAGYL